ncbi:MAG: hypothetical protein YPKNTGVA_000261 [Candidatus Fervidibacter sp.]
MLIPATVFVGLCFLTTRFYFIQVLTNNSAGLDIPNLSSYPMQWTRKHLRNLKESVTLKWGGLGEWTDLSIKLGEGCFAYSPNIFG